MNELYLPEVEKTPGQPDGAASAAWYIMKWLFPIFLDFIEKVYNMPKALSTVELRILMRVAT